MDDWAAVIDILSNLRSETFKPTIGMYTRAFNECSSRGHLSTAVGIYNVMPESLRAQLSPTSLLVVIRAHARSDRKELQLRASDIINDFRHTFSPKKRKAIEEEVQHTIQEVVVRECVDAMAESADRIEKASSSGTADSKGILGYFSSLFKR
ncbi:hypothetical protein PHYSODRAFT_337577 [Phytophthora sojae]|uniref:Uncharacterized protein n=1 Tax=Phytophthora sojae (strain P6497) TaxID=1094619 RepID=G5A1K7_PHYSP|nr:hypothetical protein PHYSODRAFT_337577 [Phytophthora sojae]EGZ10805.1 hypothetical protein PHYSODRAFT_337577 [Phytophthora sojae]|eukprot:XP_009533550.1 hypothetical protein PHYSODRAFT_337577 [Phytophthora sojae]